MVLTELESAEIINAASLIEKTAGAVKSSPFATLDGTLRILDKGVTLLGQGIELFERAAAIVQSRRNFLPAPAAASQPEPEQIIYAAAAPAPVPVPLPPASSPSEKMKLAEAPKQPGQGMNAEILEIYLQYAKLIEASKPDLTLSDCNRIIEQINLEKIKKGLGIASIYFGDATIGEIIEEVENNKDKFLRVINAAGKFV